MVFVPGNTAANVSNIGSATTRKNCGPRQCMAKAGSRAMVRKGKWRRGATSGKGEFNTRVRINQAG